MILTILEASVAPERSADLLAAFRAAEARIPEGFVRSDLVRSAADDSRWRIETLWASRAALDAMRQTGTPAGVLMFRSAGAEPTLSVFEVQASIPSRPR
jgi:quinol monooxygenase YgiN